MYSTGSCLEGAETGCWCVFLWVQYGSERHKSNTELTPILKRCIGRHRRDFERLSATPDQFKEFSDAVSLMQRTQPNFSTQDLADIRVPVTIVQSEHDEFVKREHAEYLARSIPEAEFVELHGVSHFTPLHRPEQFNSAILAFLAKVLD